MKKYPKYKDSGVSSFGLIPEHWKVERMGKYFSFSKGLPITKADLTEDGIAVISYGQIHAKNNTGLTMSDNLIRRVSDTFIKSYPQCLLEKNDFIFADTSEDIAGSGNFAFNDYEGQIFAGYHDVVARPHNIDYPPYLAALFSSALWKNQIQSLVNGVKVYSINKTFLKNSQILLPQKDEQRAIFDYVKKKSSQIDRFIVSTEAEIEALKELKQAEIARLVTRGVNPDVPMKDSGIAWIGEIPEYWEVKRIKWLFKEEDTRNIDLKYELLSFSRSKGIVPFSEINEKEPSANDLSKYKVIKPGQLLENRMQAWSGMFGCSHIEGCVSPDYAVFSAANDEVNVEYYATLFRTKLYIQQFANASRGVGDGFNRLYTPAFGAIYAHFPPAEEQQAIVDEINFRSSKIDLMVSKLNDQISHLKELKQRIISDAVTGKIDVSLSPALPSREGGKRANL